MNTKLTRTIKRIEKFTGEKVTDHRYTEGWNTVEYNNHILEFDANCNSFSTLDSNLTEDQKYNIKFYTTYHKNLKHALEFMRDFQIN